MKKGFIVLLVIAMACGSVFANGGAEAGSDKVVIGALIRNTDE